MLSYIQLKLETCEHIMFRCKITYLINISI